MALKQLLLCDLIFYAFHMWVRNLSFEIIYDMAIKKIAHSKNREKLLYEQKKDYGAIVYEAELKLIT